MGALPSVAEDLTARIGRLADGVVGHAGDFLLKGGAAGILRRAGVRAVHADFRAATEAVPVGRAGFDTASKLIHKNDPLFKEC